MSSSVLSRDKSEIESAELVVNNEIVEETGENSRSELSSPTASSHSSQVLDDSENSIDDESFHPVRHVQVLNKWLSSHLFTSIFERLLLLRDLNSASLSKYNSGNVLERLISRNNKRVDDEKKVNVLKNAIDKFITQSEKICNAVDQLEVKCKKVENESQTLKQKFDDMLLLNQGDRDS